MKLKLSLMSFVGFFCVSTSFTQNAVVVQNKSFEENLPAKDTLCIDTNGVPTQDHPLDCFTPNQWKFIPRVSGDSGFFGIVEMGPWKSCNQTPDLLPNAPELLPTMAAADGSWYLGFLCDPQNLPSAEAIAQSLPSTLMAGIEYQFKLDLAHAKNYSTPGKWGVANGFSAPGKLQLYGNNGSLAWGSYRRAGCDVSNDNTQGQLLWTSPDVTHEAWQTYTIKFTPTKNWTHIMLSLNDAINTNACAINHNNILIDNVGAFVPDVVSMLKNKNRFVESKIQSGLDLSMFKGNIYFYDAQGVLIYQDLSSQSQRRLPKLSSGRYWLVNQNRVIPWVLE